MSFFYYFHHILYRAIVKQELCKHRLVMQPLHNPLLCGSTLFAIIHFFSFSLCLQVRRIFPPSRQLQEILLVPRCWRSRYELMIIFNKLNFTLSDCGHTLPVEIIFVSSISDLPSPSRFSVNISCFRIETQSSG